MFRLKHLCILPHLFIYQIWLVIKSSADIRKMDDHEELVNLRQLNPSQKIVEVEHDMIEVRAKPE